MSALLAGLASGGGVQKQYVESVFSAYTYTGNGSTQAIVNDIDLAGKGGMVWLKHRSAATVNQHCLFDTTRGNDVILDSASTTASQAGFSTIFGFNSSGFSLGYGTYYNQSGTPAISWTFRNAPKFFQVLSVTKSSGSNATVDLSTLGTVGMVRVKRTDAVGSWYVWHRSLSAGKLLIGETTAAEATLGHITVVGTTLTLVNGVIADGTYHVEAYAHDTSADGLIQCGIFTTDGSGNATVNLGWEPQYILSKVSSTAGWDWHVTDTARGLLASGTSNALYPNTSVAEAISSRPQINATGFSLLGQNVSTTHIYLAIRRPNKPPTSGTQVYNAIARTGTGAAATVTGVGFAPDLALISSRNGTNPPTMYDRLRGGGYLFSPRTDSEGNASAALAAWDTMDGVKVQTDSVYNGSSVNYINHFFKRAPGVFDTVCYTGTGVSHTEAHGLGVVPELMIVKRRVGGAGWWVVSSSITPTGGMYLHNTNATSAASPITASSYNFTTLDTGDTGALNSTYVTYLFASKPGISKVFSFTGNGTSQTINCGFAAGARFILIKRTDAAGDWYIWDSVRGIVAGNDPHLSLNTTTAEVTTDDSIDPDASGFIVNQLAATNINVNGATYIGLAIA